jgi:hypothetical protein
MILFVVTSVRIVFSPHPFAQNRGETPTLCPLSLKLLSLPSPPPPLNRPMVCAALKSRTISAYWAFVTICNWLNSMTSPTFSSLSSRRQRNVGLDVRLSVRVLGYLV